jgi:cytochrome c oxidase subunit IV
MSEEKQQVSGYRSYLFVFAAMLVLLAASIGLSKVELGSFTIFVLLAVAIIQAVIILAWSMHLRFDQKIYAIFISLVFLVYAAVVVVTFLDYLFR